VPPPDDWPRARQRTSRPSRPRQRSSTSPSVTRRRPNAWPSVASPLRLSTSGSEPKLDPPHVELRGIEPLTSSMPWRAGPFAKVRKRP
jgi:hypothetical protein